MSSIQDGRRILVQEALIDHVMRRSGMSEVLARPIALSGLGIYEEGVRHEGRLEVMRSIIKAVKAKSYTFSPTERAAHDALVRELETAYAYLKITDLP